MSNKLDSLSLEERMELAQNGDSKAYEHVLNEISQKIRGYLIKKLSNSDNAEDVLQEVLISIHRARHTYDSSRSLMPWIMSIVKFRFNDYLRKHYRSSLKDYVEISELQDKIADNDVTNEGFDSELLKKALQKLPQKQRKVVELMKVEGYTAKEVGGKLDMSVSAVKVTAHRAYKKLRKELEELGYEN